MRTQSPFVGRESEVEQIGHLLDGVAAGTGTMAVVAGETGGGKSRFIFETMREARARGFFVNIGHCSENADLPYLPIVEMLEEMVRRAPPSEARAILGSEADTAARLSSEVRRVLPGLTASAEPPPEDCRELLNATYAMVARRSAERPILFVVEDLQWADPLMVQIIEQFAPLAARIPVLVIGTYRDDEAGPASALWHALDGLSRRREATEITLGPLSREAVAGMVEPNGRGPAPKRLVSTVWELTEGNPLLVEELLYHLRDTGRLLDTAGAWAGEVMLGEAEAPSIVRRLIDLRVSGLSEDCRRLLWAAAAAGRTVGFEVLSMLSDVHGDRLLEIIEEALDGKFIREVSLGPVPHYAFRHELARRSLLAEMALPRRQILRGRAAEAFERACGADCQCAAAEAADRLRAAGGATELPATGAAPGRTDGAAGGGISEREAEVLRLIAAGHSNREIGELLAISTRTVERHITNAYAKIGARGRADATAYALRSL